MMKTRIVALLLLLLFAGIVSAQRDIEIDLRTLSKDQKKSKVDIKTLKAAEDIYSQESLDKYEKSLPLYLKAYQPDLAYYPLTWRIAMCYLYSADKPQAIDYLLECAESGNVMYHFYLAKAYQFDGQFEEAIDNYLAFSTTISEKGQKIFFDDLGVKGKNHDFAILMEQLVDACSQGINSPNVGVDFTFQNLELLNTESDELYPVLFPNSNLIYSSSRLGAKNGYGDNIKVLSATCDDSFSLGFPMKSYLYPKDSEDNLVAMPYYNHPLGRLFHSAKTDGGDIMLVKSVNDDLEWKSFPKINSSSKESSACFLDDSTLVFSSDRASKEGMSNLYLSQLSIKGKWGKPELLGGNINTIANEEVVAFYDGALYFISNVPRGLGGYDVYKTAYLGANTWGEVINLGYPINTADNDMVYFPIDENNAFYAGVRPGGVGGVDIYKVTSRSYAPANMPVNTLIVDTIVSRPLSSDTLILTPLDSSISLVDTLNSDTVINDSLLIDSIFITPLDTVTSIADTLSVMNILSNDTVVNYIPSIDSISNIQSDSLILDLDTQSVVLPKEDSDFLDIVILEIVDSLNVETLIETVDPTVLEEVVDSVFNVQ